MIVPKYAPAACIECVLALVAVMSGLLICFFYALLVRLVFFQFKWIAFTPIWGVVSGWVDLHLLLVFIGVTFAVPVPVPVVILCRRLGGPVVCAC